MGGLLLGLVALAFPQVMTGGYGWVQWGAIGMPPELALPGESSFVPHMGMGLLLTLCRHEDRGHRLHHQLRRQRRRVRPVDADRRDDRRGLRAAHGLDLPGAHINPAAFVLVGMGGFFAGVSKTPLTSIVMVSEMTGSYSLLVPLMLACGLNMAISRRWTIYEEQVPSPIDSPAHQGDFVVDVLDRIPVGEVAIRTEGLEPIPAAMPFKELIQPGGALEPRRSSRWSTARAG